jgi:hypothetical protein
VGRSNTLWGALVQGILARIMVICKRRGKRFLDLARRLWQSSDPHDIDLSALRGGILLLGISPR